MKTLDFSKIKFKQHRYFQFGDKSQREIVGWDTETSNGQCGLLCNSEKQVIESHDIDILLMHLTEEAFQKKVNMFYNLGYDYSAILKCLPEKNIREIGLTNKTKYLEYELSIIPRKMFRISRPHTSNNGREYMRSWKYFDMWQFFRHEKSASLDAVSEKYLGEKKIDVEELTGILKSEYDFKDFKNEQIQAYCVDDSVKVAKLGKIISESCNSIGLFFNQPYSCATLSMNYVYGLNKVKSPLWFYFNRPKNRKVFEFSFNTYSGGRFEVMQRGTFYNVNEYDVNSMYPDWIRKLQSIYKTDFEFCKSENLFDQLRNKETFYAFLKVRVKPNLKFVNILPRRKDGLIIYPRSREFLDFWITLPELELLEKYDQNFKIVEGFVGTPEVVEYPYKEIFENIYQARMKYPKSHFLSSLYKIIMNSFYGKTIEMNLWIDESEKDASTCHDILDMVLDEENEDISLKCYMAGKFFCPPYATMITAPARCKITDAILNSGTENIIGCFTDSILSPEKLNLPISNQMGDWELHTYDECNIVGTGVYFLHNHENSDSKMRTRGFKFMNLNDFDFATFLRSEYPVRKSLSLKEAIRCNDMENFNVIFDCPKKNQTCKSCKKKECRCRKEVNINFDTKRKWQRDFKNVKDIFKSQISSSTIII